jgi:sulfur-oxidizing protein SoxB
MRLAGRPIGPDKVYKVAGWAPVAEGATGGPIWEVVETWLRDRKVVGPLSPSQPGLAGVQGNAGLMG